MLYGTYTYQLIQSMTVELFYLNFQVELRISLTYFNHINSIPLHKVYGFSYAVRGLIMKIEGTVRGGMHLILDFTLRLSLNDTCGPSYLLLAI